MCLKPPFQSGLKTKNKFQALEESAPSTKKLHDFQYEKVDKALFEWFALQRSQNIPIDGSVIKEEGLFFAEKNWRSLTLKH